MDSYIVRIYRRQSCPGAARRARDGVTLIGVVEDARDGTQRCFHDMEQLWSVLVKTRCPSRGRGGKRR
jgi:hypothetical protein